MAQMIRWFALPTLRRLAGRPANIQDLSVRLRRMIETSGVTPIKIGQYLAIRLDLLPGETCRELGRLFGAVPPLPFPVIRTVIEGEFLRPLEALYPEFSPEPLGAASIAQVHWARDHFGREVAVKVQRVGVEATLRSDFRNLRRLAWVADRLGLSRAISAVAMLDEIAMFTLREVDFRIEGETADRMRREAIDVHIPWIEWSLSGRRVLTMEFISGVLLTSIIDRSDRGELDVFQSVAPDADPVTIVARVARSCLRQLFITGFFQGDPHPANILLKRDGSIAFVDFGIFGELTAADRHGLSAYIRNLALGRFDEAFRNYSAFVEPTADTDLSAYRLDTVQIMAEWHRSATLVQLPPKMRIAARFQGMMFDVMRRHHVAMRREYVLFWRALAVLESTAQRLPITFDLLTTLVLFFREHDQGVPRRIAAGAADQIESDTLLWGFNRRNKILALGAGSVRRSIRTDTTTSGATRHHERQAVKVLTLCVVALAAAVLAALVRDGNAPIGSFPLRPAAESR